MNDVQKILFWGTYDIGKPRVRLLLKGARTAGFEVIECHKDIWQGIQDKSQIHGVFYKLRLLISWLLAYPRLILEYIRAPQHDVVVVPYMGQFDVLVLYPFAWLRKKPILWDVFISLYDTVIYDRKLFAKRSFKAYLLYAVEWMACRLASTIVLDTQSHAEYFARLFQLDSHRVQHIFVGAESEFFFEEEINLDPRPFQLLFYGQFIPLHGIETIVKAAEILQGEDIEWILVGKGQESPKIDALIASLQLTNIQRIPWLPYPELRKWIQKSDISLGIFGSSSKAQRVIPNKVYQVLACKKPLITEESPAIHELIDFLGFDTPLIFLVPPKNPRTLANKVLELKENYGNLLQEIASLSMPKLDHTLIGEQLKKMIQQNEH